jgi:hypothetical protein
MSQPATEYRKLPLRKVLWGAFLLPWRHRGPVFRATGMPLLAVIACSLAGNVVELQQSAAANAALFAIYGLAVSWLAINIHRLVLLEAPDSGGKLDAASLRRLGIFFAVGVIIWILYLALTMLIAGGVVNILAGPRYIVAGTDAAQVPQKMALPFSPDWIVRFAAFAAYWVIGRVSLMLPAIALDQKPDLVAAWLASRRNGWRLAVVVGVLPWSLQLLTDLLYRNGASGVEFAILVVLAAALVIVEVVALTLSYWELTSPAPPPTPPPS